jgi:hypothetical protein
MNGICNIYDSIDKARIQRQSLPEGIIKEYKEFTSHRVAMISMKSSSIGSIGGTRNRRIQKYHPFLIRRLLQ